MDAVQLDFWIASVPLSLAMLVSLWIALRGNVVAGLLLLLPFALLLSHMYITTYLSNSLATFEQVMTPYGEMEMTLEFAPWYRIFLLAKSGSYFGIPVALWLLHRKPSANAC